MPDLRVVKIIDVRRWLSDKWVVLAESGHTDPEGLKIKLQGHAIRGPAGHREAGRRQAFDRVPREMARPRRRREGLQARRDRAPRAQARAAARGVRISPQQGFLRCARHVEVRGRAARLRGRTGFQMSLQECLDGEVYYFAQREHADFISPRSWTTWPNSCR